MRRSMIVTVLLFAFLGPAAVHAQSRPEVQGRESAVVAGHPLAAAAGMDVLRRGGNAVDAAVTMAAVLAVVRPHMNGIGGDAFLLLREGRSGRVRALNGSGRSPAAATPAAMRELGYTEMPGRGIHSVTVPGAVRAWAEALRRHGTIPLDIALTPAIHYAEHGFPVSEKLAGDIAAYRRRIEEDPALAAVFLPGGEPPAPGSILYQQDLARTLQDIARDGPDAFYIGQIAQHIDAFMHSAGGLLTIADLAAHSPLWQEPIATTYAGHRVLAFPPNSQGVAMLMQMNMAELYDLEALGHNSAQYVHTLVELKKLAFAERDRYVTDPSFADIPLERLISKDHARRLVEQFRSSAAADAALRSGSSGSSGTSSQGDAEEGDGDTVFLAAVDRHGNAVALIQSLYSAFGSGRMVPGTGMILHNRGALFSLDEDHVNVLAPEKRTYHTLAPAMALRPDGSLYMVFGTPGGDGQTQTLLQVFNNIVLFGMNPQSAVEAPRWRSMPDSTLKIEAGVPLAERERLAAMGHDLELEERPSSDLGGAQVILITASGARAVGADPRREAYGIAW
ncbi:MAG TPA: gamma-glutamyltransferase [Longimicrobiales bacterium]|nr:gamma-glutamyltransferase [Longimicrobiales bacterium]